MSLPSAPMTSLRRVLLATMPSRPFAITAIGLGFHSFDECVGHVGGRFGHGDPGLFQRFDFPGGGSLAAGDDGSGVAHPAPGRRGGAGDERGYRLFAMLGGPFGCFFLGVAADLADEDDGLRLRVVVEHLEHVEMGCAVDGVAADADAGALAVAAARERPHGLVSQGAGARDDADAAALVDVAGGDADAAAAVRFLALAGRHEAGAIRADEPGLAALHGRFYFHHVLDRDAFGDRDYEVQPGVDSFEDGVGREWRRDEDDADGRPRLANGFGDGVEDRRLVLEALAAFAGVTPATTWVPYARESR